MKRIKSILLIEDDEITNFLNQTVIEETGLVDQIFIASNGLEGLAFLENLTVPEAYPDLIFLDINMPVLDGFSFLEEFNKLALSKEMHTKIVVLSTSTNATDINQMKALGIERCLAKPLTEHDFREIVNSL